MRNPIVHIGTSSTTLKPYVLIPNSTGQVSKRPLAEYFTPIRLGPADYDARQIGSTIAFPDFAGGFGHFFPDSRNDAQRSWRSKVDTRWPGMIILPWAATSVTLPSQPGEAPTGYGFVYSNVGNLGRFYLGVGDKVYYTTGTSWTLATTLGGTDPTITRLRALAYTNNNMGTEGEALYALAVDPATNEGHGDYTVDGSTWAAVSSNATGRNIIDVAQNPLTTAGVLGLDSNGKVMSSTHAHFINTGLPVGENATVTELGNTAPGGHFIGTMQGVVYLLDGSGKLWSITPVSGSLVVGLVTLDFGSPAITGVVVQNAQLALTDGKRVWYVHPTRPSREITPALPHGQPTEYGHLIEQLFCIGDRLLAYVRDFSSAHSTQDTAYEVWEFRGGGWHTINMASFGTNPKVYTHTRQTYGTGMGYDPIRERMWFAWQKEDTSDDVVTSYDDLMGTPDNPLAYSRLNSVNGFLSGDRIVETGWHQFGLRGLDGVLLRVRSIADWSSAAHSVDIEYKLNGSETSWTSLGTLTSTTTELTFETDSEPKGVEFRSVRFRLTLNKGAASWSPNAAFAVDFLKIPEPLVGYSFLFDVGLTCKLQQVTPEQLFDQLTGLAGPGTLAAVKVGLEAVEYLKLEAPRLTGFADATHHLAGAIALNANEVT